MKNTKVAFFALTAALALSPLAFGAPMTAFSLTGTPGVFDLTGSYTTVGMTNTVQNASNDFFTETGTTAGNITHVSYVVVNPTHTVFMTSNPTVKNDNHFTESDNPFDASGLLIKLTSGALSGDYVYINGINGVDSNQVDVSIFTSLTGQGARKAISTVNYYVTNNDITKTPEPSSLLLLGTGLLSLAGLVFWKSKSSTNSLPTLTL